MRVRGTQRVCSVQAPWGRERGWAVGSQNQSHLMTGSAYMDEQTMTLLIKQRP